MLLTLLFSVHNQELDGLFYVLQFFLWGAGLG